MRKAYAALLVLMLAGCGSKVVQPMYPVAAVDTCRVDCDDDGED